MRLALKFLVLALAILPAFADPAEEAKRLQWRDHALEEIAALKDFSERENARKVAGYVEIAMGTDIRFLSAHRSEVFDAARKKLESMPGHAAFLEKELAVLREERHNPTQPGDYNYNRSRIFTILRCLQTAETVELLIRLLQDNRDAETIVGPGVRHRTPSNDELAADALIGSIKELPLARDRWGGYRMDIPTLQAWGREVQEGTRTFQFKDKPGTYNIHGKIPEESREVRPGIPAPVAGTTGGSEESINSSSGIRWIAVAAVLILLAAVAKLLRSLKRNG